MGPFESHLTPKRPTCITVTSVLVATCGCNPCGTYSWQVGGHSMLDGGLEQMSPTCAPPHPSEPQHLPGKARGSEWGSMKLPKSSENMPKAFSMGGS